MAPEQARGLPDLDDRVDIWAFCAVLYEAIAGETVLADPNGHDGGRRGCRNGFGNYPALWAVVSRGLADDRNQRFQSMRELTRALADWLYAQGVDDDVCGRPLAATVSLPQYMDAGPTGRRTNDAIRA
jgi:serine/threonine-protein kinase